MQLPRIKHDTEYYKYTCRQQLEQTNPNLTVSPLFIDFQANEQLITKRQ